MSFYIKLLIILAVCSISSAFVSNVYSIGPTQSHSSMFKQQRCFNDKCTMTSCFNDNPCQTITDPNPNRSFSSSSFFSSPGDGDVEEQDNSGSSFDDILPW
jgi:hypothetical protein